MLEVSEFYHLPHGAITSHCSLLKAVRPAHHSFLPRAVLATSVIGVSAVIILHPLPNVMKEARSVTLSNKLSIT
jgi:hypothetical protein